MGWITLKTNDGKEITVHTSAIQMNEEEKPGEFVEIEEPQNPKSFIERHAIKIGLVLIALVLVVTPVVRLATKVKNPPTDRVVYEGRAWIQTDQSALFCFTPSEWKTITNLYPAKIRTNTVWFAR